MANFSTRPNLDNRDFTQTTGSTLNLYGTTSMDGTLFINGVKVDMSTGSSVFGYVLMHTVDGIKLSAPSGFTSGGGGGGVGDITGATNIGGGVGVFAQKNNKDFEFKSFIALSAVTISGSSNIIYFGVNIDETRTQNRNTVPNSRLLDNELNIINTGTTFNRSYQSPVTGLTISGAYTLDLTRGEMFSMLLTSNVTSFSFSGETLGKNYTLIFNQSGTSKTLAWASGKYRFSFGNAPILTDPTTNGTSGQTSMDIITALCSEGGRLNIVQSLDFIEN